MHCRALRLRWGGKDPGQGGGKGGGRWSKKIGSQIRWTASRQISPDCYPRPAILTVSSAASTAAARFIGPRTKLEICRGFSCCCCCCCFCFHNLFVFACGCQGQQNSSRPLLVPKATSVATSTTVARSRTQQQLLCLLTSCLSLHCCCDTHSTVTSQ